MSAIAEVLQQAPVNVAAPDRTQQKTPQGTWEPEAFAFEQIRGLVRRVFLAGDQPVKQVVFSAAEPRVDIETMCAQVSHILALETPARIALVSPSLPSDPKLGSSRYFGRVSIACWSEQIAENLWRVPAGKLRELSHVPGAGSWPHCLAELREQFDYSIIQGPAASSSSEAALLGHLTDGIILVLSAHSTRKATACKIKETLQGNHSRILGAVLSERRFPVPESIYRRL